MTDDVKCFGSNCNVKELCGNYIGLETASYVLDFSNEQPCSHHTPVLAYQAASYVNAYFTALKDQQEELLDTITAYVTSLGIVKDAVLPKGTVKSVRVKVLEDDIYIVITLNTGSIVITRNNLYKLTTIKG